MVGVFLLIMSNFYKILMVIIMVVEIYDLKLITTIVKTMLGCYNGALIKLISKSKACYVCLCF